MQRTLFAGARTARLARPIGVAVLRSSLNLTRATSTGLPRAFHAGRSARLFPVPTPLPASATVESATSARHQVSPRIVGHSLSLPLIGSPRASTTSALSPAQLTSTLHQLDLLHRFDERHAKYLLAHPPEKKRGTIARLWHDYGWVGVGSYLSIYVSTLGFLYLCVRSGLLGANTVLHAVDALGLSSHFDPTDLSNARKSDFLVAWIATKFTEPIRAVVTMALTPKLARLLGMAPPKHAKKDEETKKAAMLKEEQDTKH